MSKLLSVNEVLNRMKKNIEKAEKELFESEVSSEKRQQHHDNASLDQANQEGGKAKIPSEKVQDLHDKNTSLEQAKSAKEYATIFNSLNGYLPGLFAFDGVYYWSEEKRYGYLAKIDVFKVSNFTLDVEYFLKDDSNPEEPTYYYNLKILPKEGSSRFVIASAKDFAKPSDFTKFLLEKAKVSWMGRWPAIGALHRKITQADVPIVRVLPSIGHDTQTNCYVLKDFMINSKGELIKPDQKGFYKLSDKDYLSPPLFVDHSPFIVPQKGIDFKEIYNLIYRVYGNMGAVIIAFMVASWFKNKISSEIDFFPFCSINGDIPHEFIRILNAMQGCNDEGLYLIKSDQGKEIIRKLSQRSGLFTILRDLQERKHIDFIMQQYNQSGNASLRSPLIFFQENDPFRKKADKANTISVQFRNNEASEQVKKDYDQLIQIPSQELAWFFVEIMKERALIEDLWHRFFNDIKEDIKDDIRNPRILETHALILTFHQFLQMFLGLDYNLTPYIIEMAKAKIEESIRRDETEADYFFSSLEEIVDLENCGNSDFLKVEKEIGVVYINLPLSTKALRKAGFKNIPPVNNLHKSFKKHRAYISSNARTQINGEQKRVWVFDLNKLRGVTDGLQQS